MMDLLGKAALIATAIAFALGFMLTSTSGSAQPVKRCLMILTAVFAVALIAGLVFSRGLLIYLLFQIVALIMLWYLMIVVGAVCGGGVYALINRKTPGKDLHDADMNDYVPAAEFALQEGIDEERAISRIRSGYYQGGLLSRQWYVHKSELSHNDNQRGDP